MLRQDIFHMCVQNLKRRKSRTFLTVLGVLIGCCSIVIMVSLGIGMNEASEKMLKEMGDLTIVTVTAPRDGRGKAKLDDAAVEKIGALTDVEAVTPKLELSGYTLRLIAGAGQRYVSNWTTVVGLDMGALEKMGYKFTSGATTGAGGEVVAGQYTAYDFRDSLRPEGANTVDRWSAMDGSALPDPYFDPTKTEMTLEVDNGSGGGKFTVPLKVAALAKEDYSKGMETSSGIIMNLSQLRAIIDRAQGSSKKAVPYSSILVKVGDISKVEDVENRIRKLGYSTESMESIRKSMQKQSRQQQMMLGGLGAISLFVAALGITNTMIMSISERTREIGIMKALGCYVRDIRVMFLAEAGAIGLLGGLIGCVVSCIVSVIINLVALGPPSPATLLSAIAGGDGVSRLSVIPVWLLLFAIVFSVFIGLGSGYYPANKAVQIPALEAIKSE